MYSVNPVARTNVVASSVLPDAVQEMAIVPTTAFDMACRRETVKRSIRWDFDMRDTPSDSVEGCNTAALDSIVSQRSLTASLGTPSAETYCSDEKLAGNNRTSG